MKGRGAEVWLNVVACLLCRFWGDGAAWSAPVCTSPARLIWGSWEGWLSTANGPHKHWEGPALAYHWCRPISLQGPRENVVGLGEGIVDQGTGRPVSRLIVGEKGEWEETEKSPPGRWFLGKKKAGKDRKKREREEEYTFPLTEGVFTCSDHERSILPSFRKTSLLPFPIKKSSLFPLTASLHCLSNDLSVLPSLLHGQLNVRPIGQGVNGAAARALLLNNVWQGTNSTGRGETPSKPSQKAEESLGN